MDRKKTKRAVSIFGEIKLLWNLVNRVNYHALAESRVQGTGFGGEWACFCRDFVKKFSLNMGKVR